MSDVNERFDSIEHTLTGVSRQFGKVDDQITEVKQRLDSVDQRLDSVDQRLDSVDQRLDSVDQRLHSVDQRLDSMDTRLDTLTWEVQGVRVLGEENSTQIRLVAQVQTHHGRVLEQLVKDIEPLKVLPDLFKQVVHDHERRITALEKSSGSRQ